MGKIVELAEKWAQYPALGGGFYFERSHSVEMDAAVRECAAAHAAELAAKDKRIAELDEQVRAMIGRVDGRDLLIKQKSDRVDALEDALRELASYAGNGGYNAPDPIRIDEFIAKIRDGIDGKASCASHAPLPGDIRVIVDTLRQSHITHDQAVTLAGFIDDTFPKPVPQWELDARAIERLATVGGDVKDINLGAIAARIREAHRGSKRMFDI